MQDFYNFIPETNHISRVYIVADILYLQFVLHVMYYYYYYHHHHHHLLYAGYLHLYS